MAARLNRQNGLNGSVQTANSAGRFCEGRSGASKGGRRINNPPQVHNLPHEPPQSILKRIPHSRHYPLWTGTFGRFVG